ncbi:MAG: DUF3341 domain-containing protein [Deltaproteobacteria bacterium]|nr:MAG: DUF3341 domain-containing protein [Deltaproteobacteria bacterium]
MSKYTNEYFGVLAEFASPAKLYHGCEEIRDAGYKKWDAYTPFPVHGLEKAMGIPNSKVPWISLVGGLTGASGGFFMQWWMSSVDYPLIISGKPLFSWPAFVPVTFELGILLAAFGAVFGMLALNRLPQPYHPLFQSKNFERVTDDKFFVAIEANDPQFDPEATAEFLKSLGATNIELVKP